MKPADIKSRLHSHRDEKYAEFSSRLIPGFDKEYFIGVRTPILKKMAREIVRAGGYEEYLTTLPHDTLEENLLHAFIVSQEKRPIEETLTRIEQFLPYINNWAVCDQFSVKSLGKHPLLTYSHIEQWMKSEHLYTRRFGVVNSMRFFLDDKFKASMLHDAAQATTNEYYMQMAVAWYFATALAKQWEITIPWIEQRILTNEVHKLTIRKAVESFRITHEQKEYLRQMQ